MSPPLTRTVELTAKRRIARTAAELPRVATVAPERRIVTLAPKHASQSSPQKIEC
jgi:hypothetical protein